MNNNFGAKNKKKTKNTPAIIQGNLVNVPTVDFQVKNNFHWQI